MDLRSRADDDDILELDALHILVDDGVAVTDRRVLLSRIGEPR